MSPSALASAAAALGAVLGGCSAKLGQVEYQKLDGPIGQDGGGGDGAPDDALMPDAALGAFSTPVAIPGASGGTSNFDDCVMSQNLLDLIFAIQPSGASSKSLYEMQRATTADPWGTPVQLTVLDIGTQEETPRLSPDDLTLYFGKDGDIYTSTRATVGGAFSAPTAVATVNTGAYEKWLSVCDNGVMIVSRDNGGSGYDLFEGTLTGGATTAATTLNSPQDETSTFLSTDCLTVYFASSRSTQNQIYFSTRPNTSTDWAAPQLAPTPFSPSDGTDNEDAWESLDLHTFVFASIRGGSSTKQVYISTR